jgi:hypothetical protein
MHIITWTNKMDAFGYTLGDSDSHRWYEQSYRSPYLKQAAYRLKKLRELEAKGCVTNIKHIFEE